MFISLRSDKVYAIFLYSLFSFFFLLVSRSMKGWCVMYVINKIIDNYECHFNTYLLQQGDDLVMVTAVRSKGSLHVLSQNHKSDT